MKFKHIPFPDLILVNLAMHGDSLFLTFPLESAMEP